MSSGTVGTLQEKANYRGKEVNKPPKDLIRRLRRGGYSITKSRGKIRTLDIGIKLTMVLLKVGTWSTVHEDGDRNKGVSGSSNSSVLFGAVGWEITRIEGRGHSEKNPRKRKESKQEGKRSPNAGRSIGVEKIEKKARRHA